MRVSEPPPAARRPPWSAIVPILCLGAFFCLHDLDGKSLWGDEINMIHFVTGERDLTLSSGNALGYLPLIEAARAVGKSENVQRLPAVAFAVLGLALAMWLIAELFPTRIALGTGVLLAVSPIWVAHAQQVHAYTAFGAIASLQLVCLWRAIHGGDRRWWLGWATALGVGMWLHLYTIFLACAHVVILAALAVADRRWRRPTGRELRNAALIVLLPTLISLPLILDWIAPLGIELLAKVAGQQPASEQLKMPPSFALTSSATYLRAFQELTIWRAPFAKVHWILASLAALGLGVGLWKHRRATTVGLLFVLLPIPPIAIFAHASGIDFGTRRLIYALPIVLAFAVLGLDALGAALRRPLPARWRRTVSPERATPVLAGVVALLVAATALHHYFVAQEHADRRAIGHFLELAQRPDDRVMAWKVNLLSYYYRGGVPLETLRGVDELEALFADPAVQRLWYVRPAFAAKHHPLLQPIERWLDERGAFHIPLGGHMTVSVTEADPSRRSDRRHLAELAVALKPGRPYSHHLLAATIRADGGEPRAIRRHTILGRRSTYHPLIPWLR